MSVRDTYRIIDCLNMGEYNDLPKKDKEFLAMLISSAVLNLSEGSVARTELWSMFPENTETGQKIRDHRNGLLPGPYTPNPE